MAALLSSDASNAKNDEMRVAYLILAHRYPEQLVRLVRRLDTDSATFLIHLDKKVDETMYSWLVHQLSSKPNVHFLKRRTCYWAGFGIVRATIEGVKSVIEKQIPFDYLALLSGQDYPIKSNEHIGKFLTRHRGTSFIHHHPFPQPLWERHNWGWDRIQFWHVRTANHHWVFPHKQMFGSPLLNLVGDTVATLCSLRCSFPKGFQPYGGAQFWCLYRTHVQQVYQLMRDDPRFVRFFRFVDVPDEIFFQTVVGNLVEKSELHNDTLTYLEWGRPGATLYRSDFDKMRSAYHLFARKFDATVDSEVLDCIDEELLSGRASSHAGGGA